VKIGTGASKRIIVGKRKDAGKNGIGTGITGIAHSSFIAGKRISSFLLLEIALNATVMIGMIDPIGAITTTIGDLMGRSEEGRRFTIGWGAGSACTTGSVIVVTIFPGIRKSSKKWLMHGFPMSSYFAGMPIRIEWSRGKIVAQQQGSSSFLHGVQRG